MAASGGERSASGPPHRHRRRARHSRSAPAASPSCWWRLRCRRPQRTGIVGPRRSAATQVTMAPAARKRQEGTHGGAGRVPRRPRGRTACWRHTVSSPGRRQGRSMKAPVRSFTVLTAAVLAAAHGAAQSSASRDQHRAQREAVVVEALANRASRVREAGRTGAGNNAIDRKPPGAAWIRTAHREQTVHLERRQAPSRSALPRQMRQRRRPPSPLRSDHRRAGRPALFHVRCRCPETLTRTLSISDSGLHACDETEPEIQKPYGLLDGR